MRILYHFVHCLHDIPPATIIRSDSQCKSGITGCQLLSLMNKFHNSGFEPRYIAYHLETNAIFVQSDYFLLQGTCKKLHKKRNFIRRTTPILTAESKKCQIFDAMIRT